MNRIIQIMPLLLLWIMAACSQPADQQQRPEDTNQTNPAQTTMDNSMKTVEPSAISTPTVNSAAVVERQRRAANKQQMLFTRSMPAALQAGPPNWNRESYNAVHENGFITTSHDSLSTFSIDVDTASYANIRRFLRDSRLPPVGAVRIEEMINYFSYDYPQPTGNHPFSVTTELGPCPWNQKHQLVRIGLKAKDMDKNDLPPSNLVFLIDVSGSMQAANKLPLLKKAMTMLVKQLDARDRAAIVAYAGQDRVVLEPTPGSEQKKIITAIESLGAGGATHASSGIRTAYKLARQAYMPKGNNRIILASDGDFNVGVTSRGELERLIEEKRKSGIYLSVLGFGMGNYHDDTMEILADKGNGNYSYIDSLLEAKKVMVKEMSGTLFALARDVKIQVEFNPAQVAAYRLIGYENRTLADEDFNNDKKDAGEIGVGHTVTALYELIPAGAQDVPVVDPLKYQQTKPTGNHVDEIMTVKLRYKPLHQKSSVLMDTVVHKADRQTNLSATSTDFRFAAAVAGFGMLLTDSEYSGDLNYDSIISLARSAKGADRNGYRAECVQLMETAQMLD